MLKRLSEMAGHVQVILVACTMLGAAAAWIATLTFTVGPLEKRIANLEKKLAAVTPAVTFKQRQCAELVARFPDASDVFAENRIKDALKLGGCNLPKTPEF